MCIWIINYQPGQTVYQPIIQLFGYDSIYHELILVNHKHQWPIVQGLFKIYIQLVPGENIIQLSTLTSDLSFTLIYCPLKTTNIILRLISISFSDEIDHEIERLCKQMVFLTKLVRCTFDEILHKQLRYTRAILFDIEKKIHHVSMLKKDFQDKSTDMEIFKEIYRQVCAMDVAQDPSVKLIIHSSISPSLTFAYTFNNIIVLNLPKQFSDLPASFEEFYGNMNTIKVESLFYAIGAYLHELGHLFGLDHGDIQSQTIMSSSKGYIDAGKDFLFVSPRLCSIIFNRQCSCYREPILNAACSYSNGLLRKHSVNLQSSCKSDIHCQFALKFDHHKYNDKPNQCVCNGQFQFEIAHCHRLIAQFGEEK